MRYILHQIQDDDEKITLSTDTYQSMLYIDVKCPDWYESSMVITAEDFEKLIEAWKATKEAGTHVKEWKGSHG